MSRKIMVILETYVPSGEPNCYLSKIELQIKSNFKDLTGRMRKNTTVVSRTLSVGNFHLGILQMIKSFHMLRNGRLFSKLV